MVNERELLAGRNIVEVVVGNGVCSRLKGRDVAILFLAGVLVH
jgi:hypothetical protein